MRRLRGEVVPPRLRAELLPLPPRARHQAQRIAHGLHRAVTRAMQVRGAQESQAPRGEFILIFVSYGQLH